MYYLHTALLVSDLEKSRHFYGTVLGLTPVLRELKFPGIWYQIGPVQIHLIQVPQVIGDQVDPEKWGRNRHLALGVGDLAPYRQRLITQGCAVQNSASGRAALFIQDPDGNVIEISQIEGEPPGLQTTIIHPPAGSGRLEQR